MNGKKTHTYTHTNLILNLIYLYHLTERKSGTLSPKLLYNESAFSLFWCPYMVTSNVSIQCNGEFLPDIITLTLCDSIGEHHTKESFCPYSQCSHLKLLTVGRFRCVQIFLKKFMRLYKTSNGTDQCQNGSSNLLTPYREQPRWTRIVVV